MLAAGRHKSPGKKYVNFMIGCLKISYFLKSDFSYLALGKTRKVECGEVGEKKFKISQVSKKS